jgi:thiazole synthase ThiGH ThiG subunit
VGQTENALPCRRHKQVQSAGGRAPATPDYESLLAFTGTICKAVVNVGGGPIRDTEAAMAAMIAQVSQTSWKKLSVLAQRRIWLHPVLTEQDRAQEQIMDTGLGTLAKTTFDSLAKSIYTWSDEGKDQFLYA